MNTIAGISFYDALNKLVVGALVVILFVTPFKSCGCCMENSISRDFFWLLFTIASFVVGTLCQFVVDCITKKGRNDDVTIRKGYEDFVKEINQENLKDLEGENILDSYYKAYYCMIQGNKLVNVPTLEALERFYRSLIFIIPLWAMSLFSWPCRIVIGVLFLGVMLCSLYLLCQCAYCRLIVSLFALVLLGIFLLELSNKPDFVKDFPCFKKLVVIAAFVVSECLIIIMRFKMQIKIYYLVWQANHYIKLKQQAM